MRIAAPQNRIIGPISQAYHTTLNDYLTSFEAFGGDSNYAAAYTAVKTASRITKPIRHPIATAKNIWKQFTPNSAMSSSTQGIQHLINEHPVKPTAFAKDKIVRVPTNNGKPGRIVRPVSQFVLSSLNKDGSEFSLGTAFKWSAYVLLLGAIVKTGFTTMGDIAVVYSDSLWQAGIDALQGNPHIPDALREVTQLPRCEAKKILLEGTQQCYTYGGQAINQKIKSVFQIPNIFEGFSRESASFAFATILTAGGNLLMMSSYRQPAESGKVGGAIPWVHAAAWQSLLFGLILGYQTLSVNAGFFQYLTEYSTASNRIWDNWLNWNEVGLRGPNWDRIVSYWATYGILSQLIGTLMSFGFNAANAAHVLIADAAHGKLHKTEIGHSIPGRIANRISESTLWRGASWLYQRTPLTDHVTSFTKTIFKPVTAREMIDPKTNKPVLDPKTGEPFLLPAWADVVKQVRQNTPAETKAILDGAHNPTFPKQLNKVSDFMALSMALSVVGVGALSAIDLITGTQLTPFVDDNPILNTGLAGFGSALGSALVYAKINPDSFISLRLRQFRTTLVSMFSPNRIGYWFGAYLALATTTNLGYALLSQVLQGYKITPFLFRNTVYNSLFGGAWFNRFFYGTYNAVKGKIGSRYLVFIASYFVALWFGARAWTEQNITQFYQPTAFRFSVEDDEFDRDAYLAQMSDWKKTLTSALQNSTDNELVRVAREELVRLRLADITMVMPAMDEKDPRLTQMYSEWQTLDNLLIDWPKLKDGDPRKTEIERHYAQLGFKIFQENSEM